jgi:hypothetical protein
MCIFPDETCKMPDKLYPKIAELIGQFAEAQALVLFSEVLDKLTVSVVAEGEVWRVAAT